MDIARKIIGFWGVSSNATGHVEKLISGIGGFIGIILTMWISHHYLGVQGAALLVASMGASAVLLFAVPHGALSQPWALLGGHIFSALIGVTCAQLIANPLIAAPLAVAVAIIAMHYLRCTHPPGGATAITAVIGGEQVHALGYQFVLTPVLVNVLIMLLAAIAVNYAFPWRRYPARFKLRARKPEARNIVATSQLMHNDFEYALRELGTYVDVSEADLSKIYQLAVKHAWQLSPQPEKITVGLYYSNGKLASDMSVRKVIELLNEGAVAEVMYKIVDGAGAGAIKTSTLLEFSNWQRYEVIMKEQSWRRIRAMDS